MHINSSACVRFFWEGLLVCLFYLRLLFKRDACSAFTNRWFPIDTTILAMNKTNRKITHRTRDRERGRIHTRCIECFDRIIIFRVWKWIFSKLFRLFSWIICHLFLNWTVLLSISISCCLARTITHLIMHAYACAVFFFNCIILLTFWYSPHWTPLEIMICWLVSKHRLFALRRWKTHTSTLIFLFI